MIGLFLRGMAFVGVAAIPSACALIAQGQAQRVRVALAVAMVALTIGYNLYYFSPAIFRPELSLPLQVCDLLGFAAALALTTRRRFFRALIVLCTLPFVLQAVLTPVGAQGAPALRTFLYWSFHALIFATFLFEAVVARFRPILKDLLRLFIADLGYVAVIGVLDAALGWNYGYIGNVAPDSPTLIDVLGPWPWRIASMLGLAMLLQTLCFFLFKVRGQRT